MISFLYSLLPSRDTIACFAARHLYIYLIIKRKHNSFSIASQNVSTSTEPTSLVGGTPLVQLISLKDDFTPSTTTTFHWDHAGENFYNLHFNKLPSHRPTSIVYCPNWDMSKVNEINISTKIKANTSLENTSSYLIPNTDPISKQFYKICPDQPNLSFYIQNKTTNISDLLVIRDPLSQPLASSSGELLKPTCDYGPTDNISIVTGRPDLRLTQPPNIIIEAGASCRNPFTGGTPPPNLHELHSISNLQINQNLTPNLEITATWDRLPILETAQRIIEVLSTTL